MNFSKPPVLSDSLTTVLSSAPGLEATLGAASTALSNPLLAASWQKASGAIAFVDGNVTDYQALVAGIAPGTEVHVLNSSQDAVTQITNTLLGRHDISSLHIVSHGEAGGLNFGSSRLNLSDLPEYAAQLQSWGKALTNDADILLYGCDVAQGELGKAFTSILSQLTGADVAASDNLTGNSALGGDWTLEVATGAIENAFAFSSKALDSYTGTLTYTLGARSAVGSGGDVFLGGEFIELGIEALGGYFGTSDAKPVNFFGTSARTRVGLSIDPDSYQTGDTFTYDVFLPGTPLEGFALGYTLGGTNYAYENSGGNVLQLTNTSVINTSSGNTLSAIVTSITPQNVVLSQTYSFDYTKDYWSTALNVTNNSGSVISNLRYFRYFDPDIAVDAGGSFNTTNTILNSTSTDGRVVIETKVPSSDSTFASRGARPAYFVSVDPLARGFIGNYFFLSGGTPNAGGINALTETAKGTTTTSDTSIGIWFDVGTVAAGASKAFNYTSGLSSDIISTIEAIPSITTNTLTLTEGGTVVLSSSNLNTTDPDNTPAQLTYSVSGTPNGRFELVSAPGIAITSFTQAQINSGVVQFVHNGGETPPAYSLTVNDGLVSSAPSTVAIGTFTNVNDAPTISTNALSLSEGGSVVLSNSNINATDPDNTAAQLTYTASSISSGRFELVASPGNAITSFTQAQINTGEVRFVHDGGETAPSYSLSVSDGLATSTPSPVAIGTFTNVNDAPTISTNALSLSEGGSVVLSNSNINATDSDNTAAQLAYTASSISSGRFELVASPGNAITSFTQAQINTGAVRFVHDGGETAPSYSLSVSDGLVSSAPSPVAIGTFTNVNDAPTISTNALTIAEGATVVLSSSNLNTTDPDNTPTQLTYTASSISGGRFELVANAGVAITSFTQAQINTGEVRFVHDGGETAPSYSLSVSDGLVSSAPSPVAIGTFTNVNDAPTISTNALSLSEGDSVLLSSSNINATDSDNTAAQLAYTASSISGGRFELVASPGNAITSFTQAQINTGEVRFVHDGGETAPSYSLSVRDGLVSSAPSTVAIGTFTNVNDAPTISTNALSLSEGGSVVLSNSNINATDPDNTAAQLAYTASSISSGRFELVASPGNAITSFTQAQINTGEVRFVHDGGETAPSYSLSVSDGLVSSTPSPVAIGTFTNVNDAPTISTNALSLSEGDSVLLSSSNINATDSDNTAAQLAYTASSISGGRFELVASPGNAITSFTQAQINTGEVRFVHDGGETAPSYSLSVRDGLVSSAPSTVAIGTFTNVNDAPTISTNALSLSEGDSVLLSSSNINATDSDNTAAQLAYTASSISGGRFELVASPGNAITSFTQAQINTGEVRFVHDGGETAPSYSLSVRDGLVSSAPSTVAIGTFTNVNDAPTISTNALSLSEGGSVVLSNSNINATDPDNTAAQLTYTASSISSGRFELVASPGNAITSFTQAQINTGEVRFVHDGGETAPSYSLSVSDGLVSSTPSPVAIGTFTNVNDAPTISTNALSLSEGGSVLLSSSNINATDPDNTAAQLTYTASNISGGRFELVANAGVAITSFTQAQINAGEVRFIQDGSENAPTYDLTVGDGTVNSSSSTVTIPSGGFTTVNDAPTISTNALSVIEGGSVVLSSSNINTTDPDNTPAQLTYAASNVSGGQFELVANAGVAITSFTQAQINSGAVRFVHSGGETAPSYGLSVSDGALNSGGSTVTIGTFTNVNDAPTLTGNATLAAVNQNATNTTGSTLTSLFGSLFSDPDTGASLTGLAIVGNPANATTQGRWQYSLTGTTWSDIGTVAEGATALALSATTLVRFVPAIGYNGTPPSLSVRALDNTYSGGFTTTTPVLVNTTTNGGSTAIAATATTLSTSVTPSIPNLLWRNAASNENVDWQLNNYSVQSSYFLPSFTEAGWQIAASNADFNQDGFVDILWRNQNTGLNVIWEMNSTGLQTRYFIEPIADTNWQIAGTADYNRDGITDIVWRNQASGENVVWQQNGATLVTRYFLPSVVEAGWQIVSTTGDFNRDGIGDLLWRNQATGANVVWQMNSAGLRETGYFIQSLADANWQIAGTGDLDRDGITDIVWRNRTSGENAIWKVTGTSVQSVFFTQVADTNWQIAGVADLGGNSTPELLWQNKVAGQEVIWQMNGFSLAQGYELPAVRDANWSVRPFVSASIPAPTTPA